MIQTKTLLKLSFGVQVALCALLLVSEGRAQIAGQSVTGTVVDLSGAVVPDSVVTLTNEATRAERKLTTGDNGDFNFQGLTPGTYSLKIEKTGFRAVVQTGLRLEADQRLALGNISLPVGQATEAVTVQAENIAIHTEDAEVGATLGTAQIDDLEVKGREVMNLVKLLPGVSQTGGADVAGSTYGVTTPNIAGMRSNYNDVRVDGQLGNDGGTSGVLSYGMSVDSIGELKIETSSYLPETGPNPGTTIRITTKSGTRDFHGTLYFYKRDQAFNANDFFINRQGLQPFPYRITTTGLTLGGPIFIPKVLNPHRTKAFFFFNGELTDVTLGSGTSATGSPAILQYTTPTALERQGNFSQSVDTNGKLIVIKDPTTGAPFAGNIIPPTRINAQTHKLLDVFPLPNITNPALTGNLYNYQFANYQHVPKQAYTLKEDNPVSNKDTLTFRVHRWASDTQTWTGAYSYNGTPLTFYDYYFTHNDAAADWTRIVSPHVVNEFEVSYIGTREDGTPRANRIQASVFRSTYGITIGQLFPGSNPYGILPSMTFNGISNPVSFTTDSRAPIQTMESHGELQDNLTWVKGNHSFKFGFYAYTIWTNEGQRANYFNGQFAFDKDTNNPNDSNDPFSNALLGNFDNYQEASRRNISRMELNLYDWYAQDQWKVSRKLTLNYGVRFSWQNFYHQQNGEIGSMWAFSAYNPAQSPRQYVPAIVNGVRVAQDPGTGGTLPAYAIGAFVNGTGNPANGEITNATISSGGYALGWTNPPGVHVSPRFGFAYDPAGNGKTSIRGGFGVGYNEVYTSNERANQMGFNQPYVVIGQQFYGNIATFLNTSSLVFPSTTGSVDYHEKLPRIYNWSIGVQRALPGNLALDVSYVGNTDRWLQSATDLNAFPAGWRFQPFNQDPTTGKPRPDNLIRKYPEYAAMTYLENSNTSNYHSLQVTLQRRFAAGLQFQIAYTYSKSYATEPGTCNYPTGTAACIINPYVPSSQWIGGLESYSQNNVFVANWQYNLPKLSSLLPNQVVKAVFDRWEISGIYTYASGFPFGVTVSSSAVTDISGSSILARPNIVPGCNPKNAPHTFAEEFNPLCFTIPAHGTFGNAGSNNYTGPPINQWDMSLMKNFQLGKNEARRIRFRAEAYNLFNHTQFMTINSAARFDASGNQINTQLGQPTADRQPRILQLAATLYF